MAVLIMSIGPVWAATQSAFREQTLSAYTAPTVAGATLRLGNEDWQPRFMGADEQVRANYDFASASIQLFVARYDEQGQGKELMGYRNSLDGDIPTRTLSKQSKSDEGVAYIRRIAQTASGEYFLYWSTYRVGHQWESRPLVAQLNYARLSLISIPMSYAVAVRVRCENSGCEDGDSELQPVWQTVIQSIENEAESKRL
jgi:hypothetical protein